MRYASDRATFPPGIRAANSHRFRRNLTLQEQQQIDELKEQDESFTWLETSIPDKDDATYDIGAAVFVDDVTRITPIPKLATGNDIVHRLNRTTNTINGAVNCQGGGGLLVRAGGDRRRARGWRLR